MILYGIFGVIFYIIISFLAKNRSITTNKKRERKFMFIICIFLSLIEGLRAYNVGTDTVGYVREYLGGYFLNNEPLIKYIFTFLHSISGNPTFMLLIMALLTNGLILFAIYKESCNLKQSLFVFVFMLFYFVSFNAMRQALAYALVLNAFVSAKNRKIFSFFCFLIPALFIHSSALIGIFYIVIFLIKEENNKNLSEEIKNKMTLGGCVKKILCLVMTFFFTAIISRFLNTIIMGAVRFFPSYEKYLVGDYAYFLNVTGGISRPIVYSAIFICFVLLVRDGYQKKVYSIPLMICVALSFASYRIAYLERFMYYFDITCVLSVPFMYNNNNLNSKSKLLFKIIVNCSILAYGIYMLSYDFMRVKDYAFFWNM